MHGNKEISESENGREWLSDLLPPLKSYFQFPVFPCFFPVQLEIFPVPISEISDNLICGTNFEMLWQISQYHVSLVFSLCFGRISKFPFFPEWDFSLPIYPVFPVQWGPCLLYSPGGVLGQGPKPPLTELCTLARKDAAPSVSMSLV